MDYLRCVISDFSPGETYLRFLFDNFRTIYHALTQCLNCEKLAGSLTFRRSEPKQNCDV